MEFSVNAVANKMILVIILVSVAIALGGLVFYRSTETIPFVIGVAMGSGVNVIKVLWLKRTVNKAVTMEATAATNHLKMQYFMRLMLTLAVLLIGGFLHGGGYVNLIGIGIALLATLPVASYAMQYFIPKDEHTEAITSAATAKSSPTQDAIDEINKVAAKEAE